MRLARILVCLLPFVCTTACGPGEGSIFLTVDADGVVRGVSTLRIVVVNNGMTSLPDLAKIPGGPVDLPPPRTVELRFPRDRTGPTTVKVDALDEKGAVLASAEGTVDLKPSVETPLTVRLKGKAMPPDMQMFPAPIVTGVSPAQGPTTGGTPMTLTGSNFYAPMTITVDGADATEVQVVSEREVKCKTPPRPGVRGRVAVKVTNPDGKAFELPGAFSYFPGTVTFMRGTNVPVNGPWDIRVADANGDRRADLIVSQTAGVAAYLGGGDGRFTAKPPTMLTSSGALTTSDFDGDGKMDAAVCNFDHKTVSVVLGQGDGTFRLAKSYATGVRPSAVVAANLNADSVADLVVMNTGDGVVADHTLSVFMGNGAPDGTFTPLMPKLAVGAGPLSLLASDFDADGKVDIAVSRLNKGIGVLLGAGDGSFGMPIASVANSAFRDARPTDFNQDGITDLVAVRDVALVFLAGDGRGGFSETRAFTTRNQLDKLTLADFNGDMVVDAAAASSSEDKLVFVFSQGAGDWTLSNDYPLLELAGAVVAGDFDGDAATDLAVTDSTNGIVVLLNRSR